MNRIHRDLRRTMDHGPPLHPRGDPTSRVTFARNMESSPQWWFLRFPVARRGRCLSRNFLWSCKTQVQSTFATMGNSFTTNKINNSSHIYNTANSSELQHNFISAVSATVRNSLFSKTANSVVVVVVRRDLDQAWPVSRRSQWLGLRPRHSKKRQIHVWKFTCHGPRRRTQYAGVSTDKCTVRVKFLLSACRPVSAAVSYHSLTLESRHRDAHLNPLTGTPSVCA